MTKYWAYGRHGLKVRGIEERQHSTCAWIAHLQRQALQLLVEHSDDQQGIPSFDGQIAVARLLRQHLDALEMNEVNLLNLVVSRRIQRELRDFDVATLAHAALLRGRLQGVTVPPGGKVRFVVIASKGTVQHERVLLVEELNGPHPPPGRPDIEHYTALAIRAIWAILAPFGWDEEEVSMGQKRITLESFKSQDEPSFGPTT